MRPTDVQYTREHEWIRMEGDEAVIGVTDYAAAELGDVVFVELPEPGTKISTGQSFGSIETVKAVEDLYAPVDGIVLEANPLLDGTPEKVNEDPFGDGWLIRIEVSGTADSELLSEQEYSAEVGEA